MKKWQLWAFLFVQLCALQALQTTAQAQIRVFINDGEFTADVDGAHGGSATSQQLRLESSEDLETWTLVQTFTGPLAYTVPEGAPTAQFYRVVAP
jgi:hypothetical protein